MARDKKRVRVTGYHQNNLGDDLFFHILFDRYKDVDFYCNVPPQFYNSIFCKENVHVDKYTKLFSKYTRLFGDSKLNYIINRFARHYYFKLRKEAFDTYDADVTLVGSWFMEKGEGRPMDLSKANVENKSYTLEKAVTPKLLLGANIGPVYTEDYLEKTKVDLQEFYDVCLRDKTSYALYSFMENVRYAPDLVFNLDVAKYQATPQKKQVLFNILDLQWKVSDKQFSIDYDFGEYYTRLAGVANEYIKAGYEACFVSFCKNEGDENAVKKILGKIDKASSARVLFYDGNIDEILSAFAESEHIICGRFHGMILSMIMGKSFTPIFYNDKMKNYLRDMSFAGDSVDIKCIDDFNFDKFNANLKNNYKVDISEQMSLAKNQFSKLDELLEY